MKIDIYRGRDNIRGEHVARFLQRGAWARGIGATVRSDDEFREPRGEIAAFYGLTGALPRIMAAYLEAGKRVLFLDLGYWQRRDPYDRMRGYYRYALDGYEPSLALLRQNRPGDRWAKMAQSFKPFAPRDGAYLVAGMSEKSAGVWGLRAEEWETATIAHLRAKSTRAIIYRPKPSWNAARPLEGAGYSPPHESLDAALAKTWTVVTHHSHVALDGLIRGIPCIAERGPARIASGSLLEPEARVWPDEGTRRQLFYNLAYCQWHSDEIESGKMYDDLFGEGFLR